MCSKVIISHSFKDSVDLMKPVKVVFEKKLGSRGHRFWILLHFFHLTTEFRLGNESSDKNRKRRFSLFSGPRENEFSGPKKKRKSQNICTVVYEISLRMGGYE
jgi:hypothetical protein